MNDTPQTGERIEPGVLDWLTTEDLEGHGVPPRLVYRWGDHLTSQGLARRVQVYGRAAWLVSPDALHFLKGRVNNVGRPAKGEIDGRE